MKQSLRYTSISFQAKHAPPLRTRRCFYLHRRLEPPLVYDNQQTPGTDPPSCEPVHHGLENRAAGSVSEIYLHKEARKQPICSRKPPVATTTQAREPMSEVKFRELQARFQKPTPDNSNFPRASSSLQTPRRRQI
ncbi:hypothetical protein DY000_02047530 [Brassica cretica]|uniref:TPX2 central domain-containing protein n=1 Tax=Brassica cretica TaxID=69181 RepID=A0ABQ7F557_BRACR|nr:hypothetical protein DY000_02047530 [Brassica cretica]